MPCCQRVRSDFRRPMFGIDEAPNYQKRLDMNASFNIGKGARSPIAWIKFLTFGLAVATLVYSFATSTIPSFYPAYLTPWGVFLGVLQLAGSFVLTTCYSNAEYDAQKFNVLVKLTWLLFSVAGVIGCCITILFWVAVFDPNKENDMFDKVMTHGGVVAIVLLQGIFVDRIPMRLKHIVFSDGVAVIFSAWLAIQNTVVKYNPHQDDDDDALYDAMKWRTKTTNAIIQTVLVIFVAVPLFHVLLWMASLPGRRYLSTPEEEAAKQNEKMEAAVNEASGDA